MPILLALVLIGANVGLYTWVSVSNPGIVTAESNAKTAARVSQQAASNTATTTAAQLASNNAGSERPDALSQPAAAGASSISSMGASSVVSGTLAQKGTGCATPACVTSASPSTTNTPTSTLPSPNILVSFPQLNSLHALILLPAHQHTAAEPFTVQKHVPSGCPAAVQSNSSTILRLCILRCVVHLELCDFVSPWCATWHTCLVPYWL